MAATVAPVSNHVPGDLREIIVTITADASYPTGGYAVTFPGITNAIFVDTQSSSAGHPAVWNYATGKLQFFTSGGTEVANAATLAGVTVRAAVLGK